MKFIFFTLCLNFINRADCNEKIFEGCKGSEEVYVQWYPPISGWYSKNKSAKNEYARIPPNMTDFNRYEILLEGDEWNIILWANWSKSIELQIKDNETFSKAPKATNTDFQHSTSSRKRRGVRGGLTRTPIKESKDKTTNKTNYSKKMAPYILEENKGDIDKTSFNHDVQKLNVYCPERCQCTKAVVKSTINSTTFTRFDVADRKTKEKCWGKIENATDLPEENKEVHRSNQSLIDNYVDYNDNGYEANQWIPELYVSEECEVLHYNKMYDIWIVDFEWEKRSCNVLQGTTAGLELYYSNDSAPCIEYLPSAKYQQWSNAQPYHFTSNLTEDPLLPDDVIEHCGMNFTMKPNKNFNVTCTKFK